MTTLGLVAYTKNTRLTQRLDWIIEDFDAKCPKTCEKFGSVDSPCVDITLADSTVTKWFLRLSGEDKNLKCFLFVKKNNSERYRNTGFTCKFGVYLWTLSSDTLKHGFQAQHTFTPSSFNRGWSDFISVEELYSKGLVIDGKLRIRLRLIVLDDASTTISLGPVDNEGGTAAKRPRVDSNYSFQGLLGDPKFSDVTLKCGTMTFPVHKAILAARSEVFAKMLTTEMKESILNEVEITDLEPYVLQIILQYIYTGDVAELDHDQLLSLVHGAEKYGLKNLKDHCFGQLVRCITVENVGALAVAAYLYGAEKLIRDAITKYMEPKFLTLMKKPDFRKLVDQYQDAFFQP